MSATTSSIVVCDSDERLLLQLVVPSVFSISDNLFWIKDMAFSVTFVSATNNKNRNTIFFNKFIIVQR